MGILKELDYLTEEEQLTTYLESLTIQGLENLIKKANHYKKNLELVSKQHRDSENRLSLKVGDIVELHSKRFIGEIWEVLKLNPKKALCRRENGEEWRIPYANIKQS